MTNKGGYLRTNWRETGQALPPDAFGTNLTRGSAIWGGAGRMFPYGGLIFLHYSVVGQSVAVHNGVYSIGGDSVLASAFGTDGYGAGGTGYKIWPIAIFPRFISATAGGGTSCIGMHASITTSDDSTIRFYTLIASLTADNHASYWSNVFDWVGFIVSGPGL